MQVQTTTSTKSEYKYQIRRDIYFILSANLLPPNFI